MVRFVALASALFLLAGCSGNDEPAPAAPPYEVVSTDDSGNRQDITVEVETAEDLAAVFDAVRASYAEDGAYFVEINCAGSTTEGGGSTNRLGNGEFAVGQVGAVGTGLDEGGSEFAALPDVTCP